MHSQENSNHGMREDEVSQNFILRLRDWQDKQSWDEVYRLYHRLVHTIACRAGLNEAEAWDAVQETFVTLAKQSLKGTFDPERGSFKSWLLHVAQWRINDQLRKRGQEAEELPPGDVPDSQSENFDKLWEREWQQDLMRAALARVRQKSPRQFRIFDYHVLQGMDTAEVGRKLGISASQVYLAKHRVGSLLRREIEELRRAEP